MSKIKLLIDVVKDIRSLADSLETLANACADGDNHSKVQLVTNEETKFKVSRETVRETAVRLSRSGKREEIKQLIEQYGVKNITAVKEDELDSFYAELISMEDK